ncbi:MAG: ABC transporter ATP-binding protein [Anaeroplasmataceae bacterium]|nr:ABC transporter ATP-binding protein [Anaeroplasmataceae bacterium]
MKQKVLSLQGINKKYGNKQILENITFDVEQGEFLSLLGSSGCGKTTLLKLLVGIETPTSGAIYKDGIDISALTPFERKIGIVFQNYALFPNMNVFQNIAFALRSQHLKKEEIEVKVKDMIEMVGLSEHIYKKPNQLSGGQQQRVAIARTLIMQPDIILLDEPMSALDASIRMVLRKLLKEIQKKANVTMIYVTHDQEEAFAMSERILILNNGKIEQLDTPSNIYHNPKSDFVKSFIVEQLDEKVDSIRRSIV